jgi:iron complex transport system ATP-binding protein
MFTTHDPNQALRYANRALLLRQGTRVAEGPVEEVPAVAVIDVFASYVEWASSARRAPSDA